MSPSLTSIRFLTLVLATGANAFSLSELITTNFSHPYQKAIAQQNPAVIPPFPILQVGLDHILGQMGENATEAENATIAQGLSGTRDVSRSIALNKRDTPAQCGPNSPCIDGSCCNSVCCAAAPCLRSASSDISRRLGRKVRLHGLQLQQHGCDNVHIQL
jgi:hypothetical protein